MSTFLSCTRSIAQAFRVSDFAAAAAVAAAFAGGARRNRSGDEQPRVLRRRCTGFAFFRSSWLSAQHRSDSALTPHTLDFTAHTLDFPPQTSLLVHHTSDLMPHTSRTTLLSGSHFTHVISLLTRFSSNITPCISDLGSDSSFHSSHLRRHCLDLCFFQPHLWDFRPRSISTTFDIVHVLVQGVI